LLEKLDELDKKVVQVVCDTSPGATTWVARGGLLIRGTKALDAQAG
jgi:hypothetical protein